jgi:acyl-CoA synthetase (AMP-forming)/AMP-acid ligase II
MTLIPNPRDIGKFVQVLKQRPFHLLPAVNTLFNALLQHPQFKSVDFSHLCVSQAGGMAASEGTARQWQKVTGCAMVEGWGMSETCAIGTNNCDDRLLPAARRIRQGLHARRLHAHR